MYAMSEPFQKLRGAYYSPDTHSTATLYESAVPRAELHVPTTRSLAFYPVRRLFPVMEETEAQPGATNKGAVIEFETAVKVEVAEETEVPTATDQAEETIHAIGAAAEASVPVMEREQSNMLPYTSEGDVVAAAVEPESASAETTAAAVGKAAFDRAQESEKEEKFAADTTANYSMDTTEEPTSALAAEVSAPKEGCGLKSSSPVVGVGAERQRSSGPTHASNRDSFVTRTFLSREAAWCRAMAKRNFAAQPAWIRRTISQSHNSPGLQLENGKQKKTPFPKLVRSYAVSVEATNVVRVQTIAHPGPTHCGIAALEHIFNADRDRRSGAAVANEDDAELANGQKEEGVEAAELVRRAILDTEAQYAILQKGEITISQFSTILKRAGISVKALPVHRWPTTENGVAEVQLDAMRSPEKIGAGQEPATAWVVFGAGHIEVATSAAPEPCVTHHPPAEVEHRALVAPLRGKHAGKTKLSLESLQRFVAALLAIEGEATVPVFRQASSGSIRILLKSSLCTQVRHLVWWQRTRTLEVQGENSFSSFSLADAVAQWRKEEKIDRGVVGSIVIVPVWDKIHELEKWKLAPACAGTETPRSPLESHAFGGGASTKKDLPSRAALMQLSSDVFHSDEHPTPPSPKRTRPSAEDSTSSVIVSSAAVAANPVVVTDCRKARAAAPEGGVLSYLNTVGLSSVSSPTTKRQRFNEDYHPSGSGGEAAARSPPPNVCAEAERSKTAKDPYLGDGGSEIAAWDFSPNAAQEVDRRKAEKDCFWKEKKKKPVPAVPDSPVLDCKAADADEKATVGPNAGAGAATTSTAPQEGVYKAGSPRRIRQRGVEGYEAIAVCRGLKISRSKATAVACAIEEELGFPKGDIRCFSPPPSDADLRLGFRLAVEAKAFETEYNHGTMQMPPASPLLFKIAVYEKQAKRKRLLTCDNAEEDGEPAPKKQRHNSDSSPSSLPPQKTKKSLTPADGRRHPSDDEARFPPASRADDHDCGANDDLSSKRQFPRSSSVNSPGTVSGNGNIRHQAFAEGGGGCKPHVSPSPSESSEPSQSPLFTPSHSQLREGAEPPNAQPLEEKGRNQPSSAAAAGLQSLVFDYSSDEELLRGRDATAPAASEDDLLWEETNSGVLHADEHVDAQRTAAEQPPKRRKLSLGFSLEDEFLLEEVSTEELSVDQISLADFLCGNDNEDGPQAKEARKPKKEKAQNTAIRILTVRGASDFLRLQQITKAAKLSATEEQTLLDGYVVDVHVFSRQAGGCIVKRRPGGELVGELMPDCKGATSAENKQFQAVEELMLLRSCARTGSGSNGGLSTFPKKWKKKAAACDDHDEEKGRDVDQDVRTVSLWGAVSKEIAEKEVDRRRTSNYFRRIRVASLVTHSAKEVTTRLQRVCDAYAKKESVRRIVINKKGYTPQWLSKDVDEGPKQRTQSSRGTDYPIFIAPAEEVRLLNRTRGFLLERSRALSSRLGKAAQTRADKKRAPTQKPLREAQKKVDSGELRLLRKAPSITITADDGAGPAVWKVVRVIQKHLTIDAGDDKWVRGKLRIEDTERRRLEALSRWKVNVLRFEYTGARNIAPWEKQQIDAINDDLRPAGRCLSAKTAYSPDILFLVSIGTAEKWAAEFEAQKKKWEEEKKNRKELHSEKR
eukprot:g19617.t1